VEARRHPTTKGTKPMSKSDLTDKDQQTPKVTSSILLRQLRTRKRVKTQRKIVGAKMGRKDGQALDRRY